MASPGEFRFKLCRDGELGSESIGRRMGQSPPRILALAFMQIVVGLPFGNVRTPIWEGTTIRFLFTEELSGTN